MILEALELSTRHVPTHKPDFGSVRYVEHHYGWILFVCDKPSGLPEWLSEIWRYANEKECALINFDRDANQDARFKIFDWQ